MNRDDVDRLVETVLSHWSTVAFFAYDGFERHGKGVVGVDPPGESADGSPQLVYIVYAADPSGGDPAVVQLIDAYDPANEILVQYMQAPGRVRTMRLRTAPGAEHPKRIWFFEMLRRVVDCPETIGSPLPEWFVEALERLQAIRHDP